MADITNQQLLDSLTNQLGAITDSMVTKKDLDDKLKDFATKDDLERSINRLERIIKSNHTVNIRHHLEARAMIGDINHKFDNLREGLAQAIKPT